MAKKKISYILIIILVCMALFGAVLIISYCSNLNKSDTSKDVIQEPLKDKLLYRIFYRTKESYNTNFYDFQITDDYDVLSANKVLDYSELQDYIEEIDGERVLNLTSLMDELKNSEHIKTMDLSSEQKKILKKMLNEINYTLDFGDFVTETDDTDYFISNYQTNKAIRLSEEGENSLVLPMINSLSENNPAFFNYLNRDNNFKNYIRDVDYKELDLSSLKVVSLYSMATFDRKYNNVLDNYIEEKITNDMIITLTLQKLFLEEKYESKCKYDEFSNREYCHYLFLDSDVERYAKMLFGNDVEYDSKSYQGIGDGSYGLFWYSSNEGFGFSYGTGSGLQEAIIKKPVYAYETDKKIVIIEKGLLYYKGFAEELTSLAKCNISKKGIYNNARDKLLLNSASMLEIDFDNYLDDYESFVTYYSYTFKMDDGGIYYIADFERLN